jgi:diadenosine tetraphosphatase ApaH/serine/threonine PP2A family protein phosphatase
MTEEAAFDSLALTTAPLVLVGHTHLPLALTVRGNSITGGLAPGGTEVELADSRWLLNPGSVGQPRDGDPRAAWLMLDLETGVASFRRTEYPIERTQAEITELGLPAALATRLALGQ